MSIGEVLKQARAAAELSQEEIAEKVGVSRQTISNWENGKSYPDIACVLALSDAYNITLDSLMKGDSKMIRHLEESTNVTKSNRQVVASIIALCIFLLGTAFTIMMLGGSLPDFINLPSLFVIFLMNVVVLTITRSFKLFAVGLKAALFPRKIVSDDVREQAASLYRLLSKTTVLGAVVSTLISLTNMLMSLDFADPGSINKLGGNAAAALISSLYGMLLIILIIEPVIYMLKKNAQ